MLKFSFYILKKNKEKDQLFNWLVEGIRSWKHYVKREKKQRKAYRKSYISYHIVCIWALAIFSFIILDYNYTTLCIFYTRGINPITSLPIFTISNWWSSQRKKNTNIVTEIAFWIHNWCIFIYRLITFIIRGGYCVFSKAAIIITINLEYYIQIFIGMF